MSDPTAQDLTPEQKDQLTKSLREAYEKMGQFEKIKVMAIPEDVRRDLDHEARMREVETQIAQLKKKLDEVEHWIRRLKSGYR
jgi:regulator of sirC expression with transglutaminase-like and TPR domain